MISQAVQSIAINPPPFVHKPAQGVDLMGSSRAAERLAYNIVRVWAERGHRVDAWVVKLTGVPRDANGSNTGPAYVVQSDLVNGMPSGLGRDKWERKYGRGN